MATAPLPADPTRREFLKAAATGLATAGIATMPLHAEPPTPHAPDPSLDAAWRKRMQAPDDGKRYGWLVDVRRCFGCHGCEVACKAENDVPLGHYIRQTLYVDYENHTSQQQVRIMVPLSCQHCEDAPCIKACPCGALHKGPGGSVQVDYDVCSGHGACVTACPYGAIYLDPVAKQAVKCHNCTHRLAVGMEPACVATCPAQALVFGDLADPHSAISKLHATLEPAALEVLRPAKQTQPRMAFVTNDKTQVARWEPRVPREGQSYAPATYSIYSWEANDPAAAGGDHE